jgi:outer membrane lipoprotein SlyB
MFRNTLVAAAVAAFVACSTTSPDVIQRSDAQRLSQVQDATVLSVRPVIVEGSQSGAGAATGGVLGGLAGSSHSSGREQAALGIVGAVAGAVIGHAVERGATREKAVELLLQMRSGERRAIVQAAAGEAFQPGDAVILVSSGGKTRVTKAPPGTVPAAPPAPVHSPGGRS